LSAKTLFQQYFQALRAVADRGDAREESFYACLRGLVPSVAVGTNRPDASFTMLLRPGEAICPDGSVVDIRRGVTAATQVSFRGRHSDISRDGIW